MSGQLFSLENKALNDEKMITKHQATHDQLTTLPNRKLFMERLGKAICDSTEMQTQTVLCYLDLDKFKQINCLKKYF